MRQMVEEQYTIGEKLPFAAAEAYKLLRANLQFALPDEQKCRVIGVTSPSGGEGKSTTAVNLAYMLAEAGERVLLMEADMRLASLSGRLMLRPAPGLSNVLAGLAGAADAIQPSGLRKHLDFISAGVLPPNPPELLGSERMRELIGVLRDSYDFILMDLPPVTEVADALVASRHADGMVVVVCQGRSGRRALAETMRQLEYAQAKVLGFVMTRSGMQTKKAYRTRRKNQEKLR